MILGDQNCSTVCASPYGFDIGAPEPKPLMSDGYGVMSISMTCAIRTTWARPKLSNSSPI